MALLLTVASLFVLNWSSALHKNQDDERASSASNHHLFDAMILVRDQPMPTDEVLTAWQKQHLLDQGFPEARYRLLTGFQGSRSYWSFLPWFTAIAELDDTAQWYIFLEPETVVNVSAIYDLLSGYDSSGRHFFGHALKDAEASIAHHYKLGLQYPFIPAGFAISSGLITATVGYLKTHSMGIDFQIDVSYEMSKFLKTRLEVPIQHFEGFCPFDQGSGTKNGEPACITWTKDRDEARQDFGLDPSDVLIAVKTTRKFHGTRLPVLHTLWASKSSVEVVYLSDDAHQSGPVKTVDLTKLYGIRINQERGHCAKTDAILKYFIKYFEHKSYLVIVDDDTLLSVPNLLKILRSYNHSQPVYLGERYGYGHRSNEPGSSGYDYITMGGGVALSKAAVLKRGHCLRCTCPSPDTPDDMQMGLWMKFLRIPAQHEGGFHQSEPRNFHELYVRHYTPVSFHRFEKSTSTGDIDVAITKKWFAKYLGANAKISSKAKVRQKEPNEMENKVQYASDSNHGDQNSPQVHSAQGSDSSRKDEL